MALHESVEDFRMIHAHGGETLPEMWLGLPSKCYACAIFGRYILVEKRKKKRFLLSFEETINPRSRDTNTQGPIDATPDKTALMRMWPI